MSCPLFSRQDNTCQLAEGARAPEEEEQGPVEVREEPVDLAVCLAADRRYRRCPAYRNQFADLFP